MKKHVGLGVRLGALAIGLVSIVGCGDDGVVKQTPELVLSSDTVSVAEGGTATFTIALSQAISVEGTVQLSIGDSNVATISPQVITFAANDTAAKTVTVTGVQDDDLADDTTPILFTAESITAGSLTVNVDDDDTQALVLSSNAITMTEGTTASVGVNLAFQPSADTTVTITSADARLGASPTSLTFTASNYRNPQNVTLAAGEDADVVNNQIAVTVASSGVTDGTVAVSITDNDTQGIQTSVPNLALVEGGADGTFQVTLTQQPTSDVTINVASTDTGAATVSPSTLTFTSANYDQGAAHVVTVSPVGDTNTADETLTVTLSGGALSTQVGVTVDDDDVQAIQVGATATVTEGATSNLPVRLAFDPGAQVTVAVASADATIAGATPTMLTFDSTNYATPQNVVVSGTEDPDLATEMTTLTFTSTGLPTVMTMVTVTDNDIQAIDLTYAGSPGTLNLPEGTSGSPSTATVGVRLAFQPATTVTVDIASSNADLTTSATQLTFDPANYATPQNITLTSVDEVDLLDESATVTFTAGATTRTLDVTMPDTDVQGFFVTPATLPTIAEGGNTTFQVRMNFAPSSPITATITSNNPNVLVNGATSTSITIPVGNTLQTVTVAVSQDPDAADEAATLTISDSAVGSPIPNRTLSVTGDDDETMAFILTPVTANIDGQRLDVLEEGADVTFTVALTAAPEANATVTLAPSATNTVTVSTNGSTFTPTTSITFTPAAFGPQTITVRGLADPNLVDEVFNVTVSGPGSLGAADAFVYMRKIENDAQSIVTVPAQPGPVTVTEGTASQLSIRLQYQPVSSTQITVTPSNANIELDGTSAPITLLFTTTNYDQPQIVTVTTPQDDDQFDDVAGTITVSSPALASRVIDVVLRDEDDQRIITSVDSVALVEFDTPVYARTFTVRLAFEPTEADETITLTVPPAGIGKIVLCDGTVTAHGGPICNTSLALTFSNVAGAAFGWDQPQTVTVRSLDDADILNHSITVPLASNRAPFAADTVVVTVQDDDTQNIVTTSTTASLIEGAGSGSGGSAMFGVHLTNDPSGTLTVTATSTDPAAVAVSPATHDYTSATYTADQSFFVTPVDDPDVRDETVTVNLTAPGVTTLPLTVTVADDDQQQIIATGTLDINEGGSATLNVRLSNEPSANVTVLVASTSSTIAGLASGQAVTVNGSASTTLTFTSTNWMTTQAVTVAAPEDADLDHFDGTIDLSVTSGQTGRELAAAIHPAFRVRDNDSQSIVVGLDPAGLINSAQEGGPYVEFRVHLGARPRFGVTDTIALSAPGNVRFYSTGSASDSRSFDATNFAADQTVRWYIHEWGTNTNFTGAIGLFVDESGDPTAGFGAGNANALTMHAVRGLDDDTQQIVGGIDYPTDFNGATNFTQRSNVAWAPDGTAEGRVAFTARTTPTGGSALLGFTTRALGTPATGPTFATGGLEPTTEIVLYNADGAGSWDVFSSSASGIVFARYTLAGGSLIAPAVVAPAADNATDFSVARNGAVYGVIYRREAISRNNLYFRTVTIATGAASSEQVSTTANAFIHFHPTLHAVGGMFDGNPAPYAAIYNENGVNKLVRLNPAGAPVASVTFGSEFPGQNFSHSVYVPSDNPWYGGMIWAANVVNVGPLQGDNEVQLYRIFVNSTSPTASFAGSWPLTDAGVSPMAPVSPPFIAFNGAADFFYGDLAIAYDSNLNGTNRVSVALFNWNSGPRNLPLSSVGDEGLYPSLAWAKDRWVLRYQTDNQASTGIRLRTGSFEGDASGPPAVTAVPAAFSAAAARVGLMR